MDTLLPTADELQKLPMRAVVAYAARNARRLSSALRGIVAEPILDDALRAVDTVWRTHSIAEIDRAAIVAASQRVAEAYAAAPAGMKSPERFLLVFSLVNAALAAVDTIEAAAHPGSARHQMERAAAEAQKAASRIAALDKRAATTAAEAARNDYELLLKSCGGHEGAT